MFSDTWSLGMMELDLDPESAILFILGFQAVAI